MPRYRAAAQAPCAVVSFLCPWSFALSSSIFASTFFWCCSWRSLWGPRASQDPPAAVQRAPRHPNPAPRTTLVRAPTRPPCPAAHPAPRARTVAYHAPHAEPTPKQRYQPGPARGSTNAATRSSRSPPAPTPLPRDPLAPAARTARDEKRLLPHRREQRKRRRSGTAPRDPNLRIPPQPSVRKPHDTGDADSPRGTGLCAIL